MGTSLTGRFTKYGGGRLGKHQALKDYWSCQSCALQMPKAMPPFLFEFQDGEYARVCPMCFHEKCLKLMRRIAKHLINDVKW